ncbi:hemerythrin domain-containing protein [Desulfovibrionales bacterium]
MKATEQLKEEHAGIQLMLEIIQIVAKKMLAQEEVSAEELCGILDFFTVFVDTCHHGKEEDFLFPVLEAKGIARDGGPIGVMLHEHELGRSHIASMKQALGDCSPAKRQAHAFHQAAEAYVLLLTQHIAKENTVLFPMADKVLSPEQDLELYENFEKLEVERIGLGRHEEFHAFMDTLVKKYNL